METIAFLLSTLSDTEKLGKTIGQLATPGDVICLDGDLGAGKTALSQAIARGLQVDESCYVTSPSFAIMHEYPGRLPMYHMDFYRLTDAGEILDLGFDEYFYLTGISVVEWAERGGEILPVDSMRLTITLNDDQSRLVSLAAPIKFSKMVTQIKQLFTCFDS